MRRASIAAGSWPTPKERVQRPGKIALIVLSLLAAKPAPAHAVEAEVYGRARLFYERLPDAFLATRLTREPEVVTGANDLASGQLFAVGRVWGQALPALGWQLGFDTGLISVDERGATGDGVALGTHVLQTWLLGETFLDLQPIRDGRLLMRAGKLRPQIGAGAIFDAYAFGGLVDYDLRYTPGAPPVALRAFAGLPSGRFDEELKSSPLFSLEAVVEPVDGLELKALGALFIDGDDALAPVVGRALVRRAGVVWNGPGEVADLAFDRVAGLLENDLETRGEVGWVGGEIRWRQRRWRVQLTGIASLGRVETSIVNGASDAAFSGLRDTLFVVGANIRDPDNRARFLASSARSVEQLQSSVESGVERVVRDTRGFLGLAQVDAPLAPRLDLSGFFIVGTGEDGAAFADPSDALSGFSSVAPLLPFTDILFSGSTAPSQQSPSFSTVAPEGSGVWGVGLGPRYRAGPVDLDATAALAWSDVPPPDREAARFFGLELNGGIAWLFAPSFYVYARGAWLATGSYFGAAPDAFQLFGGVGFDASTRDRGWAN